MKKYFRTIVILLIATATCLGQKSEPYKYVWAAGGMNLRVSPNTSSKVISKVPFGDSLIVLSTTEVGYTSLLLKNKGEEKHPLLLKSQWVEVLVNNEIGYMIDGYLFDFPCPQKDELLNAYLCRMATVNLISKFDGVFKLRFGHVHFKDEKIEFGGGKEINYVKNKTVNEDYPKYDSVLRYFRGFSSSELIVFLDPFYNILNRNSNKLYVVKNWTKSINIWDGSRESIEFSLFKNGVIVMYYEASC